MNSFRPKTRDEATLREKEGWFGKGEGGDGLGTVFAIRGRGDDKEQRGKRMIRGKRK